MVNPVTTNVLLQIPLHGAEVDTWDVPMNSDFTSLDGYLAGVQTVNVAGSSPVTLTAPTGTPTPAAGPSQSQNAAIKFTGLLTGNVQITLPLPGPMIVHNLTTGAFVLSFRAVAAGQVIAIEQGTAQRIYNDGTNVYFVDLPTVGSYLDVCDATVPAWITACTVPPYLNCNGGTFSAVTYPYLNLKLGSTTLPDMRGTTRYTLNQGTGRLTTAGSQLDGDTRFSLKNSQARSLITGNLPAYTPVMTGKGTLNLALPIQGGIYTGGGSGSGGPSATVAQGNNAIPGTTLNFGDFTGTITMDPQGGTSTPFGLTGTGTVSGITLIRAA